MQETREEMNEFFNIRNMHTVPEHGTSVPAFLGKLWKLVEDPETDDLICWAPNGRSFFIKNQAQFSRELLPHYYKHNNMASFVRQLNMYGFHKKVSVELGGLKCDRDEMEFAHQYFCKGHPYLLDHIKRKIATAKIHDPSQTPIKPELMNKMLTEVRSMRGRQEHLDSRLGAMKRENEALWRELAVLRQKHLKQQQIVNKLIHFLVTLVQPSRSGGLSVKRRFPLMIDDSNRQRNKQSKLNKAQASPGGPVIHELDFSEQDLDSQYIVAEMLENEQNASVESPGCGNQPIVDEDASEALHFVETQMPENIQYVTQEESNARQKRPKGKKKRKNNVPIKILIPPTVEGEKSREETFMLEVPEEEEPMTITVFENNIPTPKPVPLATARSSKLAAMAANLNRDIESETEPDLTHKNLDEITELEEQVRNDPSLVKLENIMIIPEMMNEEDFESGDNRITSSISTLSDNSKNTNSPISTNSADFEDNTAREQEQFNFAGSSSNGTVEAEKNNEETRASTSGSPNNLSLSCVNSSDITDESYRLGETVAVDTHLETVQSELENLREMLRGEGYSIDANTLLGAGTISRQKHEENFLVQNKAHDLFGGDDPMSYGIPMNPDLDPHSNRERGEEETNDVNSITSGGELMTYNPMPTLLDFDDDMFLNDNTSQTECMTDIRPSGSFSSDPLEIGDSKNSILDTLIAANNDQASN